MSFKNSINLAKKHQYQQSKDNKQSKLIQKVKQKFSYNPSIETQKCISKAIPRLSQNTIRLKDQNSDINCQYSSVKYKNLQTNENECNETSSWIAKLVHNIQEEDQKNIQRLSQIQKVQLNSDFQEGEVSQNGGYNQFLVLEGKRLFTDSTEQEQSDTTSHVKVSTAAQMVKQSYSKAFKQQQDSIKQKVVEYSEIKNQDGLKGPPVTRASSFSKRGDISKKSSIGNYIQQEKQNQRTSLKSLPLKRKNTQDRQPKLKPQNIKKEKNKSPNKQEKSNTSCRTGVSSKKTKFSILQEVNSKASPNIRKKSKSPLYSIKQLSGKSLPKQTNHQTANFAKKVSLIGGQEIDIQKQKNYILVRQNSKDFNIQKLFNDDTISNDDKSCRNKIQVIERNNINISNQSKRKKIGSIHKNNVMDKSLNDLSQIKKYEDLSKKKQKTNIQTKKNTTKEGQKFNYIITQDFLMNKNISNNNKSFVEHEYEHERIFIDLESSQSELSKTLSEIKQPQQTKDKSLTEQLHPKYHAQASKHINQLFNKIVLNPSNQTLSKNNIKLRGLNQDQKCQLGVIISKVHYSNAQYNFQQFQEEYLKNNSQCMLSGCCIKSSKEIQPKNQIETQKRSKYYKNNNNSEVDPKANLRIEKQNQNLRVNKSQQQLQQYKSEKQSLIFQQRPVNYRGGHYRRNSKRIKKKLFEDIRKIAILQQQTINQIQKSSKVSKVSKVSSIDGDTNQVQISTSSINNNNDFQISINTNQPQVNKYSALNICKDPYVEQPTATASQMAITNKILMEITQRSRQYNQSSTLNSQRQREAHLNNLKNIVKQQQKQLSNRVKMMQMQSKLSNNYLNTNKGSSRDCLIEKLNNKLTTYITTNHLESTFKQFNLNFSELKKHIR